MSDVGLLLELLHGARSSYSTARASVRIWRDEGVEREARQRREEARSGIRSVWVSTWGSQQGSGDTAAEGEWVKTSKLWVRSPFQVRLESDFVWRGERATSVALIDGEWWWTDDTVHGFTTSERRMFSLQIPELDLLDPWQFASDFHFEVRGDGTSAGREAIEAHATARPLRAGYRRPTALRAPKGEEYDLLVDRERGVLLRTAALLDEAPYEIAELTEISFDEDLGEDLFKLDPPPEGERRPKPFFPPSSCSFCGKSREEVEHLVVGNPVYICNECSRTSRHITRAARGPTKDGA